jgi:hypothetical protein
VSRNSDRMIRDKQAAFKMLNTLSDALIVDLVRRAGTRATDDISRSEGPKGKGSYTDPTAANVIRRTNASTDPVWEAVKDIATTLNDIAQLCLKIDEKVRYVTGGAERVKQSTIIYCQACEREIAGTPKDRVRSGYCSSCYAAWTRSGRPYRYTFEVSRRAETSTK